MGERHSWNTIFDQNVKEIQAFWKKLISYYYTRLRWRMPETLLYKGQLHFCVEGSPTHIAPHRGASHLFKMRVFPIFSKRTCCTHVANFLKLICSYLNIPLCHVSERLLVTQVRWRLWRWNCESDVTKVWGTLVMSSLRFPASSSV